MVPETAKPERYKNGSLTREGMEAVIKEGGSVDFDGKTISRLQDLPTEIEILQLQKKRLDAHLAEMDRERFAQQSQNVLNQM